MKNHLRRKYPSFIKVLASVFLFFLFVNAISRGPADCRIGRDIFEPNKGNPPMECSFVPGSKGDINILTSVGGVAATQTASPHTNLDIDQVSMYYDSDNTNGQRLVVRVNGIETKHDLPDWMIVPIAKFADSEHNAMVSLFGPETTSCDQDKLDYHIVYHEAFQNTLLGVRLMQSDILFSNLEDFWQYPKWIKSAREQIVFKGSEEPEADEGNFTYAFGIHDIFEESRNRGESPISWVLNDLDDPITFNVSQNNLVFDGYPHYYFWNAQDLDTPSPTVFEEEYLTQTMRKEMLPGGLISQYNPFVYNALIKTTHYAAFFRYVKEEFPNVWNDFLAELNHVPILPDLLTPTNWNTCKLIPDSIANFDNCITITDAFTTSTINRKYVRFTKVSVAPNPTTGLIRLAMKGQTLSGDLQIDILNINGQKTLLTYTSSAFALPTLELDVSTLPAGMYLVRVSDGRVTGLNKFLKQ